MIKTPLIPSKKMTFLFPGQGSQEIGMAQDIANAFPEAKDIFDQLDDICQKPISKLCFEGPMDELTMTVNLQPAVTATNLACLLALKKSGIKPYLSAGHSLGEFAALAASQTVTTYDALKLAKKRGELMHRESIKHPGAMAAVIGLEIEKVGAIVKKASDKGVIAVANHNSAEQVVITGEKPSLDDAVDLVKTAGGKAVPLKVSGAWHCDLMAGAVNDFRQFMGHISFSNPESDILFNATAEREQDPEKIKDIMAKQLVSPVRWHDIILRMIEEGIDIFVEVGPKKVLTGLLKKIIPLEDDIEIHNVRDLKGLEHLLKSVG